MSVLTINTNASIAICRFAEPLALTSVYPYLVSTVSKLLFSISNEEGQPEMIESFGVKPKDVARWAGFAGASFSFAQALTAILWGRASDRFGRKPTIMTALFSVMTACLVWGMSQNLAMAIAARALAGACNGNGELPRPPYEHN